MCEAHRYLYDLDVECLSEDEIKRVDKLFDLGVKKGYIDNSFEEELEKSENPDAVVADEEPEKTAEIAAPAENHDINMQIPCWTILYSATKNGETKCGECYSNAISVSAAKADCLAKLERFGYGNISVLAIEAGDSDCVKMTETEMRKGHAGIFNITEAEEENTDDAADDAADDTGDDAADDTADDTGDDTADDTGDDTGDDTADDTGDNTGDADDADDNTGDDTGDNDATDDTADTGNDTGDDNTDNSDGDSSGDTTDDSDTPKELSDEEKSELKDEYKTAFREVMLSCKFEGRSFIDLTIPEKTQFFSALNVKWKKNDPKDFMSEEEQDQLESIVVNPQ